MADDRILAQRPSEWTWVRGLFCVILLVGCSGGDNPPASSSSPPTTPGAPASGPFNQGTGFNGSVYKILLAEDGSGDIYVCGSFTSYNGSPASGLIRLHPDGSVANRFDFDGNVGAIALTRTGGGELYVAGGGVDGPFSHLNGEPVPPLVRLTPSGALDPGFSFTAQFAPSASSVSGAIAVAEDGSGDLYAVYIGPSVDCEQCGYAFQIARLNADGSLDPAFSTRNGFPGGLIGALLPTSNGKLYVGGSMSTYNGVSVPSLLRLNADGTPDPTFMADVGTMGNVPAVVAMVPARDGTQDVYAGLWLGSIRVQPTGARDTAYEETVDLLTFAITPTGDGTNDVWVGGVSRGDNRHLKRVNRTGTVVSTFKEPDLDAEVYTIVPILDGTRDFYIGGLFTTYNGIAVNHFARVHADGSQASVVSTP
jgi:hypothetical protein